MVMPVRLALLPQECSQLLMNFDLYHGASIGKGLQFIVTQTLGFLRWGNL